MKYFKILLAFFVGAGAGYFAGVKLTKNKAEVEIEQRETEIRELYRAERRAKRKEEKAEQKALPEKDEKPSLEDRTVKLSEKKEAAENAMVKYGAAFKGAPKKVEPEKKPIRVVDAFPQDSDYEPQVLVWYADGVLAIKGENTRIREDEIDNLVGRDNLKLLEGDDVDEILVRNDLHQFDYTVTYSQETYYETHFERTNEIEGEDVSEI